MMLSVGDLIKKSNGDLAEVTRGGYTHRFMEAQDYEMEDNGMGDYAGVYGTAYDITYMTGQWQGRTVRIQAGKRGWTRVADEVKVEET